MQREVEVATRPGLFTTDLAALRWPLKVALAIGALAIGVVVGYIVINLANASTVSLAKSWSGPFWLTLRIVLPAIVLGGSAGTLAGYALAKARFPGRDILEAIGSIPMILPPTVLGYYLIPLLGPAFLGSPLEAITGEPPLFHMTSCIIAAAVVAFPFCLRSSRAAFEGLDSRFEEAARVIGLPTWRVALQVSVPLARTGIGVGLTLGFLRALGEFGATLLVGGAVAGRTLTMSIAVTDSGSTEQMQTIVLILLLLAFGSLTVLARLERRKR